MAGNRSPTFHRVPVAAPAISVLVFSLLLTDVLAQDDPVYDDSDERTFDEVVVTGSRINRRDFSSPSPIATIDLDSQPGADDINTDQAIDLTAS